MTVFKNYYKINNMCVCVCGGGGGVRQAVSKIVI